jgi:hypothetical protein
MAVSKDGNAISLDCIRRMSFLPSDTGRTAEKIKFRDDPVALRSSMDTEEDCSDAETTLSEASRQRHDEENASDGFADANTYELSPSESNHVPENEGFMLSPKDSDDSYDGSMPDYTGPWW